MAKTTAKKTSSAKTAETTKPEKKGKASKSTEKAEKGDKSKAEDKDAPKRKLGLRGAAPWAARHAAKHAAEARARAAEPPPPGSARATIRTPDGVEGIKAQIIELHNAMEQMRTHRKNIGKNFFEVGLLLRDIQARKLFGAKGYQSFESFLDREVDIGKAIALRLAKLVGVFQRDAAIEYGLDKIMDAMIALEATTEPTKTVPGPPAPPASRQSGAQANRGPIVGRLTPSRAFRSVKLSASSSQSSGSARRLTFCTRVSERRAGTRPAPTEGDGRNSARTTRRGIEEGSCAGRPRRQTTPDSRSAGMPHGTTGPVRAGLVLPDVRERDTAADQQAEATP